MEKRQQNPNSFILFKNDRKEKENQPDMRGFFTDENGKEWTMSGWYRNGKNGTYLSGQVSEKTTSKGKPIPGAGQKMDDLPFQ